MKFFSSFTFVVGILTSASNLLAVPVISGIPLQNDDGVTTDLFDVSQGTIVTNSSPLFPNFTAEGTFGSTSPQAIEGFRTIFADTPIATDFITFTTPTAVNLSSYRLILGEDGNGSGNRAAVAFRLYASNSSGDVLSHLVSGSAIGQTYTLTYGSPQIEINDSISVPNVQFFRLELDRSGTSGPRVFELDGFGTAVPEASAFLMPIIALVLLGAHKSILAIPGRFKRSPG
jgi:hypothetical protein